MISLATEEKAPARDPAMMPWPLTRAELELAGGSLRADRVSLFTTDENPGGQHWLAEFRRD